MKILRFNSRCPFCQVNVASKAHEICEPCYKLLPWIKSRCQHCGLDLLYESDYCGHCSKKRFAFDQVFTVFNYDFPIQRILHQFKYHQQLHLAKILSQLLAKSLKETYFEKPQLLLPLPLHPKKQRQRGYNQAIEIARILSTSLQIPLGRHALQKIRWTESQSQLRIKARRKNIRNAFCVNYHNTLPPRIAIVDDIVSSCFTAHEAAKVCKKAGAETVAVWCLARAKLT